MIFKGLTQKVADLRRSSLDVAEHKANGFDALGKQVDARVGVFKQKFQDGKEIEAARPEYEILKRIAKLSSPSFGIAHMFVYGDGTAPDWERRPKGRVEKENAARNRERCVNKISDVISLLESLRNQLNSIRPAPPERSAGALEIVKLTSRQLLSDKGFDAVDDYLQKIKSAAEQEVAGVSPGGGEQAVVSVKPGNTFDKIRNSIDIDLTFWKALLTEFRHGGERAWYGGIWKEKGDIFFKADDAIQPFERRISPVGVSETDMSFFVVAGGNWFDWKIGPNVSSEDFARSNDPEGYFDLLGINREELKGLAQEALEQKLKAAMREAAKKYHPDTNPGNKVAEEKMKRLSNFRDLMKNSTQLKNYLSR